MNIESYISIDITFAGPTIVQRDELSVRIHSEGLLPQGNVPGFEGPIAVMWGLNLNIDIGVLTCFPPLSFLRSGSSCFPIWASGS